MYFGYDGLEGLSYDEQLRRPEWKAKRIHIIKRDRFRCVDCGAKDVKFHVHHIEYIDGRLAWDYHDSYLVTLCEPCHDRRHGRLTPEKTPWLVAAIILIGLCIALGKYALDARQKPPKPDPVIERLVAPEPPDAKTTKPRADAPVAKKHKLAPKAPSPPAS